MKERTKSFSTSAVIIALAVWVIVLTTGRPAAQPAGRGGSIVDTLDQIEARLASLEKELIPCTPERYREGLCEPNDTPFDLVVNLCASAGGEAKLEGKFAFDSKTSAQAGVGWKEVLDVDLTVEAGLPGIVPIVIPPTPIAVPVILPSEVAVGAGAAAGVGMDGCLQATEVPIGEILSRAQILAMLDLIEQGQGELVTAFADAVSPTAAAQGGTDLETQQLEEPRFDTATLVRAIDAARAFASTNFETTDHDPLDVLSSAEVGALRSSLPVGSRLQFFLDDPGLLIPELGPINRTALCDRFAFARIRPSLDPVCSFVGTLPPFAVVSGAFGAVGEIRTDVENMQTALGDLPEVIRTTVEDALPEVSNPTPPPPGNAFCNLFPNSRFCT